ncbi:unnamed protein product [Leptidea sinapis]|uniref:PPM-type phosphatase domain-containing protein n=1 Tax=Leptidea sinapis TaxID=189913 RepID=A0A5E4PM26_9NEOP|nr:unnamed protein product [Leptidea sinapis]
MYGFPGKALIPKGGSQYVERHIKMELQYCLLLKKSSSLNQFSQKTEAQVGFGYFVQAPGITRGYLASNNPIEDTRSEAQCKLTPGLLMGIYDGHGGPACAQVLSKRLLKYVAAALLPAPILEKFQKEENTDKIIETFNDKL